MKQHAKIIYFGTDMMTSLYIVVFSAIIVQDITEATLSSIDSMQGSLRIILLIRRSKGTTM
jgi:hypothetical protein